MPEQILTPNPDSNIVERHEHRKERMMERLQVGNVYWVAVYRMRWSGNSMECHVKPFPATLTDKVETTYGVRLNWDFSENPKFQKRRNNTYYIDSGIVCDDKTDCELLYDQKVLEAGARADFSRKKSIYKNLILLSPPVDDLIQEAVNWKEGLTDVERTYIDKLIEMSK